MKSICVFCGSSDKIDRDYLTTANQLGDALASRGFKLIYGGGSTGMMGALADGVLKAGGIVIGVIPELFNTSQLAHNRLTRMEVVPDMHQRKARMADLADAFIALPGGFGTMEELFEIITWAQIGLHQKAIGVLDTHGYFSHFLAFIDHAIKEGFIYADHQDLIMHDTDPGALLEALHLYQPPPRLARWLNRQG
jgi:uncharacterized protein (TIGR00730 family)